MLNLLVKEKNIVNQTPSQSFVRGSVGQKLSISFEEFWERYNKTIVFKRIESSCVEPIVMAVFNMTEEITIPWEILEESGSFVIGVYGTTETETLPTLWSEEIRVEYGTDTYGNAPQPPTPNVYDQLITLSKNAVDTANSVRADADSGKFDGEKGEKGDKGDKGDSYTLTLADKTEIADIVLSNFVDVAVIGQ